MLLLIDNYDSFTWNLVQRFLEVDPAMPLEVVRNDRIDVEAAERLEPSLLVISPGPCTPKESGVSPQLIERFRGRIPILGVCLGHQAIGDLHGMTICRNDRPMHGKTSPIHHDCRGIFEGLSNPFQATRYHSLIVRRDTVPASFEISAWTAEGEVMGLRWLGDGRPGAAPLDGVQFHPESFLTLEGPRLLANFVRSRGCHTLAPCPSTPLR
ncbi:MAG TPA: aminodeoxychorismate/anthranilate synthase component II [Phycisphaerales bacterium]|nr:aminodeoxychorismate/anthranilate synthase component II [Phycisphaerales bacterium]HMP38331.1 aminodeoxychorismate/anthranilate synthase component II [Phycisphaerales bacterium]